MRLRAPKAQRARDSGESDFSKRRFAMTELEKLRAIIQRAARSVPLPGAPQVSTAHQQSQAGRTKPTQPASAGNSPVSAPDSGGESESSLRGKVSVGRTSAPHGASPRTAAHRQNEIGRTEPNHASRALTSRQLAATRWVAQGMSSSAVARKLGTIRQTINRWKQLPAFEAEVRRLHEMLAMQER